MEIQYSARHPREQRSGFLLWGLLNLVLGFVALFYVGLTTLLSVAYLGLFFAVLGAFQMYLGFKLQSAGGFWSHFIMGIISVAVGVLILRNPVTNALVLTALLSIVLFTVGIVRIIGSLAERHPHWGYDFFNGVISILAAVIIYTGWPVSGVWVIGTLVGISLIVQGATMTTVYFRLKHRQVSGHQHA